MITLTIVDPEDYSKSLSILVRAASIVAIVPGSDARGTVVYTAGSNHVVVETADEVLALMRERVDA